MSLATLYVCLLSARGCLIGLLVATTLGFYRHTLGLGAVDLRVTDVFYVALVASVLRGAQPDSGRPTRRSDNGRSGGSSPS